MKIKLANSAINWRKLDYLLTLLEPIDRDCFKQLNRLCERLVRAAIADAVFNKKRLQENIAGAGRRPIEHKLSLRFWRRIIVCYRALQALRAGAWRDVAPSCAGPNQKATGGCDEVVELRPKQHAFDSF